MNLIRRILLEIQAWRRLRKLKKLDPYIYD